MFVVFNTFVAFIAMSGFIAMLGFAMLRSTFVVFIAMLGFIRLALKSQHPFRNVFAFVFLFMRMPYIMRCLVLHIDVLMCRYHVVAMLCCLLTSLCCGSFIMIRYCGARCFLMDTFMQCCVVCSHRYVVVHSCTIRDCVV